MLNYDTLLSDQVKKMKPSGIRKFETHGCAHLPGRKNGPGKINRQEKDLLSGSFFFAKASGVMKPANETAYVFLDLSGGLYYVIDMMKFTFHTKLIFGGNPCQVLKSYLKYM